MQAIYVAGLGGDGDGARKKKLLLHENMTHPRSVIVDPESGLLYWTDWPSGQLVSRESGKIESAWMDGTHRKLIISENTR